MRHQFEWKCEGIPSPKTPPMSDSRDEENMEEEEYNEDHLGAYPVLGKENEPISEPEEAKDAVEMVEVEIEEESEEEKEEAEMVEDEAEEIENDDVQEDDEEEEEREPYGVEVEDDADMDILKRIQEDPSSYADRKYMPPGGSCEEEQVEEFEEKEEEEVPWPYRPGRRPSPRGGWRARLVAEGWVPKNDTRPYWTVPFHGQNWKPINS